MNIIESIGRTPLVELEKVGAGLGAKLFLKSEFFNPLASVKDRIGAAMIEAAEADGSLKADSVVIEPTSGNTGIALAMAAAVKGYALKLIMPSNQSEERKGAMRAYGAELIEVTPEQGMEGARDLAMRLQAQGEGLVLNQFANPDNPGGHYGTTGSEIWEQTQGEVTHFVSSMGTTGTIMGVSRFLKQQNPDIQIIGLQPTDGSQIPGIRRWPAAYLPDIYQAERVDRVMDISQSESEEMMRRLAKEEGLFAGVSSGGAVVAALRLSAELENATIVAIICDRGDRYLSTGVFS